ncbi:hypothetical protein [Pseudidiomarina insulisalsae]|uniref:Uncharacterized protein n=1 Tax=Pseudidiomarina insulisalsae TaxID=575789 RepID=A0A432YIE9_9GAMM|nr:hypothetical protein [Pseudidiomarina insulisalsae]RUO60635.1 hypothetical protein CWI71_07190 [Pseudidiomarina insulisalsae]
MSGMRFVLTVMAMTGGTPVLADAVSSGGPSESPLTHDANINAAKERFDAYIQANYGNNYSCGVRLLTPDETLKYRYASGEVNDVASFSTVLKVTDYTPIYDLAKHKSRPSVVSRIYYIEDK